MRERRSRYPWHVAKCYIFKCYTVSLIASGKRKGEVDRDTECKMYLIVNKIGITQFRAYNIVARQMSTPKDKLEAKELASANRRRVWFIRCRC